MLGLDIFLLDKGSFINDDLRRQGEKEGVMNKVVYFLSVIWHVI